jgi:hypothetical protein
MVPPIAIAATAAIMDKLTSILFILVYPVKLLLLAAPRIAGI